MSAANCRTVVTPKRGPSLPLSLSLSLSPPLSFSFSLNPRCLPRAPNALAGLSELDLSGNVIEEVDGMVIGIVLVLVLVLLLLLIIIVIMISHRHPDLRPTREVGVRKFRGPEPNQFEL